MSGPFPRRTRAVDVAGPGRRGEKRRPLETERRRIGPQALGKTVPGPVLGAPSQSRTQGLPFDQSTQVDEPGATENPRQSVGRLIDAPRRLMADTPPAGVGNADPGHEACEGVGSARTHDQMPAVRHDGVGEQSHSVTIEALGEHAEKSAIVGRARKERRATKAAIDDVKVGHGGTGWLGW